MKRLVPIIVASFAFFAVGCASSHPHLDNDMPVQAAKHEATNKAAIGVSSPRHLKVTLLTARQMLSGQGTWKADTVEIVVYGKALHSLQKGSELADAVAKTQKMGAHIVACQIALKGLGIDRATLLDGVGVVPNGLTELVRLQSLGYNAFAF